MSAVQLALSRSDLERCFPVLRELRPAWTNPTELADRLERQQREGAEVAFLVSAEIGEVVTVAVFRVHHKLCSGLTLYVDDLVTAASARSQGHGGTMLRGLIGLARERGCATLALDSGTQRTSAHAFYFREGLRVVDFHFELPLG